MKKLLILTLGILCNFALAKDIEFISCDIGEQKLKVFKTVANGEMPVSKISLFGNTEEMVDTKVKTVHFPMNKKVVSNVEIKYFSNNISLKFTAISNKSGEAKILKKFIGFVEYDNQLEAAFCTKK